MAIYFVASAVSGRIKIGYTGGSAARRLDGLRREHRDESLELLAAVDGERDIERALHVKFGHLRTSGEWWFQDVPELRDYVVGLVYGRAQLPPAISAKEGTPTSIRVSQRTRRHLDDLSGGERGAMTETIARAVDLLHCVEFTSDATGSDTNLSWAMGGWSHELSPEGKLWRWTAIFEEPRRSGLNAGDGGSSDHSTANATTGHHGLLPKLDRRASGRSSRGALLLFGVSRDGNKFRAEISFRGTRIYLGRFATKEEAHRVAMAEKARLYAEDHSTPFSAHGARTLITVERD